MNQVVYRKLDESVKKQLISVESAVSCNNCSEELVIPFFLFAEGYIFFKIASRPLL
jgi:hypothetical protein